MAFDCCASPTVITAPSPVQATYEYWIGDTQLNIGLAGDWTGDNACCTRSPDTYTFIDSSSATAPAGLFTVAGDKLSVDVYTTDVTPTGPGGESYTVTVDPPTSPCITSSYSVSYTVNVVNKCETATFTIDSASAVFLAPGTPSVTHSIAGAT